jgi:microcystin-dependent protein
MASIPRDGTILTGDLPTGQTARFSFRAPSDFWLRAVFNGLFAQLVYPEGWTQGGTATEQDAADIFGKIVWTISMSSDVGQLLTFATISLPAYCLPCDGASYLRADYPELFAAIGVLWGNVDSTHFNVPDLRGRTMINADPTGTPPFNISEVGGEVQHTLNTLEIPSHSHGNIPTFTTTAAGLEPALASVVVPFITTNTGSTGGDEPHNNMQPFAVVNWGIVYTDDH